MLQPLQGFEEISSALHFEFTFFAWKTNKFNETKNPVESLANPMNQKQKIIIIELKRHQKWSTRRRSKHSFDRLFMWSLQIEFGAEKIEVYDLII